MAKKKAAKGKKEVERHVVVTTMVIEVPKDTDIEDMSADGVVPNLAEWVTGGVQDVEDPDSMYVVRDVAVFTEHNFMAEVRRYGHPSRFPDVWVNGPPPELHVVNVDRKKAS